MDELQALWNKASQADHTGINRGVLERLISRKSGDELERFRRVVVIEYYLTLILFPVVAIGAYQIIPDISAYLALVVFFAGCLFFYRRSLQKFRQIHVSDNLQTYLQKALAFLKSYVRQYIAICWVGGIVGLFIGYFGGLGHGYEPDLKLSAPGGWLDQNEWVIDAGFFLFVIGGISAVHFYIKYLYSARIRHLQQLLDELNEV
ncbi:MAG: hypothetical protein ACLFOZ_19620 [Cyclobacteriaceae bacterium]